MSTVVTKQTVVASAAIGVLALAIKPTFLELGGFTTYLVRGILFIVGGFVVIHGYRLRTQHGSTRADREGRPRG